MPLRDGAQPEREPATCESQVRCPANSVTARDMYLGWWKDLLEVLIDFRGVGGKRQDSAEAQSWRQIIPVYHHHIQVLQVYHSLPVTGVSYLCACL